MLIDDYAAIAALGTLHLYCMNHSCNKRDCLFFDDNQGTCGINCRPHEYAVNIETYTE